MIVTIHQPEHLVWLGLLSKISKSDVFIIFDDTQFKKNYYENRNKIKSNGGWLWLTVPIKKHSLKTNINKIEISTNQDWKKDYLNLIKKCYSSAPYYDLYMKEIESIILKDHKFLVDLNLDLLFFLLREFNINKKVIRSSELLMKESAKGGSDLCLTMCKEVGAKLYIAGPSSRDYLDLESFEKCGIKVTFHDYIHPVYPQQFGEFLPFMSSVDALFNLGKGARELIK